MVHASGEEGRGDSETCISTGRPERRSDLPIRQLRDPSASAPSSENASGVQAFSQDAFSPCAEDCNGSEKGPANRIAGRCGANAAKILGQSRLYENREVGPPVLQRPLLRHSERVGSGGTDPLSAAKKAYPALTWARCRTEITQ